MREVVYVDEDFESLIPLFIKNQLSALEELKAYVAMKDRDGVKFMAHKIKGSARNFGFKEVGNLGEIIEAKSQDMMVDELTKLINQIKDYLEHVEIKYIEM